MSAEKDEPVAPGEAADDAPDATRRPPVEPGDAGAPEGGAAEDPAPAAREEPKKAPEREASGSGAESRAPSTLGSIAPSPPEGGPLAFLRERLALPRLVEDLLEQPIVGGPTLWRAVFGAWLALLVVLVATGIALGFVYSPSVQTAWASVRYIQEVVPGGAFLRALHLAASDSLVVMSILLPFAKAMRHAHRPPYEVAWWLGLATLPLVLAAAITGHALPWDQFGWWARRVEVNIAQSAPGGDQLAKVLLGGSDIGGVALSRFHLLHVLVIPLGLALVLLAERAVARRLEVREATSGGVAEPYFPRQALWDTLAGLVAFGFVAWVATKHPAKLDAPADPQRDYPARPEWFLMAMYELRHYFKGKMEVYGTSLLPAAIGAWLALLPLVDRRPGGPARRLVAIAPFVLMIGAWGYFSRKAMGKDAADEKYQKAVVEAAAWRDRTLRMAADGVPPDGPLAMIARDPVYRAEQLYAKSCAPCHVLGEMGDRKKISGPFLENWSTEAWLLRVMHEPDHVELFGKTPFKGNMPSMDVKPKDGADDWAPMKKADMEAVAHFLFLEGVEKGEPKQVDEAKRAAGEKIVKDSCTMCHLYKADGDLGGNGFAPELKGYGSFAWVRAQITNPASPATYRDKALEPTLKGHMPRFDEELPPADIELLARYVRAQARGLPFPPPKE